MDPIRLLRALMKATGYALAFAMVMIAIVFFASFNDVPDQSGRIDQTQTASVEKTSDKPGWCTEFYAYQKTKAMVSLKLLTPSQATFPLVDFEFADMSEGGNCKYRIVSYVDTQNEYGAQIRLNYNAVVEGRQPTGTWRMPVFNSWL